ncbi:MAG: restriction system protein [Motiliproteus sp.]
MAIPDYQSLMLPFLQALADNQEHRLRELSDTLANQFELTDAERQQLLPSGNQAVMVNRVGWARTYLKKAGLLEAPRRAVFVITERGQEVLASKVDRIDARYLKRFDEFLEFQNLSHQNVPSSVAESAPSDITPTEAIEQAHKELNAEISTELLATIKQASPQFFERLVVELMQAMGYGGWSSTSGNATQYSSDGGIDGIINEDPLGLDIIYLQAKRYTDNSIGRPDVQAFAGALDMKRAKKGVFITTSRFSRDATEYVSMIEKKIVLIDGAMLADLMLQHDLGVSVKDTYQVKTLDTDYFNED